MYNELIKCINEINNINMHNFLIFFPVLNLIM